MFPHCEGTSAPTSAAAVVVYALNRNSRIYFLSGESTSSPTSAAAVVVCALNRKKKNRVKANQTTTKLKNLN